MVEDNFDRLLKALPEIATAVNGFDSKEVQEQAFAALINSLGVRPADVASIGSRGGAGSGGEKPGDPADGPATEDGVPAKKAAKPKKAPSTKRYSPTPNLNFAPQGKQSLDELIADKQPTTNHEKCLLAVYYLCDVMDRKTCNTNDVLAVFLHADWDKPSHPDTTLQATKSVHHWIETSDMDKITVQWAGTKYISDKMPKQPKAKK
ncbi:hypothetical protein E0H73_40080 [Kribbella pittospori]|uniref:Uncharacterized protein n=1 Tax=Kribbella pittospori TaxID=722689 RepID=A0A4R0K325_9ACTN|nr:hypothetical protein [Kribbella pittospori]TCC52138.1 hypothetical protein E0H73_40080 [Kribbella pittospori]